MRGVGINQATEKIEIDRYSSASEGVTTSLIDEKNPFLSFEATLPSKGSWLKYDDVDFDCIEDGDLTINVKAADDTKFCIREGSPEGTVIAYLEVEKSKEYVVQTASLESVPKGVVNLVITNEGEGAVSVDWVKFINNPNKDKDKDKDKENEEEDKNKDKDKENEEEDKKEVFDEN